VRSGLRDRRPGVDCSNGMTRFQLNISRKKGRGENAYRGEGKYKKPNLEGRNLSRHKKRERERNDPEALGGNKGNDIRKAHRREPSKEDSNGLTREASCTT